MKLYIAMCSLCLLTGAALGHLNGQYAAASHFVDDCDNLSVVVFRDAENATDRHFHCFEIATDVEEQTEFATRRDTVPMI